MQYKSQKIIRTAVIKDLVKQFKAAGYKVEKPSKTEVIVTLGKDEMFRAMAHSSGKHWLAVFDSRVLTEGK